jgi:hypothetical protein
MSEYDGRSTFVYLGAPEPAWIERTEVPLFVSYGRLRRLVRKLPRSPQYGTWALDSRGFKELEEHGRWTISAERYMIDILRYDREIGNLCWVSPQDWMCEPAILARTGLSELEHQRRSVASYVTLYRLWEDAAERGETNHPENPIMPVLQSWTIGGYRQCWELFHDPDRATRTLVGRPWPNIDLENVPIIGVGSVCTRQSTAEIRDVFDTIRSCARDPEYLPLHGFGLKASGLTLIGDCVTSCDSQAWSLHARKNDIRLPECDHARCTYCLKYATRWWLELLRKQDLPVPLPWFHELVKPG